MKQSRKRPRQSHASSAYRVLVEARSLAYISSSQQPTTIEVRLAKNLAKLTEFVQQFKAVSGEIGRSVGAELPAVFNALRSLTTTTAATTAAAAAALRFCAILDDAYMELFCADALEGGSSGNSQVPAPHLYMASVLGASARGHSTARCSECPSSGDTSSTPPTKSHGFQLLCAACTVQNPQLAYLRLRALEASSNSLLDLPRLCAAALKSEGLSVGPASETMRASADPLGCTTMRQWQDAVRLRVCAWSSFACPNAATAKTLLEFCGPTRTLHEVGAGTGYWAAYLRSRGLQVVASDSRPVDSVSGRANEYHSRLKPWCSVLQKDAAVGATAAGADGGVLFLCYPPPGDGGDMGLSAVLSFESAGGTHLAIAGETRGDTGSIKLERHLAREWILAAPPLDLAAYANTAATLTLWRKGRTSRDGEYGDGDDDDVDDGNSKAVTVSVRGELGMPLRVTIQIKGADGSGAVGVGMSSSKLALATSRPTATCDIVKAIGSLGGSSKFSLAPDDVSVSLVVDGLFVPLGEVKTARRDALRALSACASALAVSVSACTWPLTCANCRKAPSASAAEPMLRDRLSRSVVACSADCARHPTTIAAIENALRLRHLPSLSKWSAVGVKSESGADVAGGLMWRKGLLL